MPQVRIVQAPAWLAWLIAVPVLMVAALFGAVVFLAVLGLAVLVVFVLALRIMWLRHKHRAAPADAAIDGEYVVVRESPPRATRNADPDP